MPSVGSLLVTLKADVDSLRADLEKAKSRISDFEKHTRKAGESAAKGLAAVGMTAETVKKSVGNVATGVLLMTGAFEDAGKAGRLMEQSLGAFLVGGPIAAGVAAVSGVFKMLAEDSAEAAKKAEEAAKRVGEEAKKQAKEVEAFWRKVQDERANAFASETERLRSANERLRAELYPVDPVQQMENELAQLRRDLVSVRGPETTGRRELTREEQMRATQIEERIVLLETKVARELDEAARAALKAAEAFHAAEDAALKKSDLDRKVRALSVDNERVAGSLDDAMGIVREVIPTEAARDVGERTGREIGKGLAHGVVEETRAQADPIVAQIDPLFQQMGDTLAAGLTDAIMDGISTGFENGAQIAQQIVNNLLAQTLNSILSSGLNALFGSLLGGAGGLLGGVGGGAFGGLDLAASGAAIFGPLPLPPTIPGLAEGGIVTRPTLALLGEGGEPEYVIPRSKMGGVNVSVSVAIQQSNLEAAADLAAAKVRQAVLESGSYARDMKRGLTKRL